MNLHDDVPFAIFLVLMQKFSEVCPESKRQILKECQDFNILLQTKVLKYFKEKEK